MVVSQIRSSGDADLIIAVGLFFWSLILLEPTGTKVDQVRVP